MCKLSQDILNHIKGHSSPHDILEQYQAGIPINRVILKHARIWAKIFEKLNFLDSISRHPVLDQLYISSLDGLYIRVLIVKTVRQWVTCSCQKKIKLDTYTQKELDLLDYT